MTFRTTVRDGLIIINTHGAVPDGTEVEIALPTQAGTKPAGKRAKSKAVAESKKPVKDPIPGFGAWRNRKDLGSGAEFVDRLRRNPFKRDGQ